MTAIPPAPAKDVQFNPTLSNTFAAIKNCIPNVGGRFPRIGAGATNKYEYCQADDWVEGFWPGQLWLAYAATGDEAFSTAAKSSRDYFTERLDRPDGYIHDFGFMYSLASVADFAITGNEQARDAAIRAAEILANRFNKSGKFIQAWNENERSVTQKYGNRGKMIIDCMENLPLLFWATTTTGRPEFAEIAKTHAATTEQHLIREDFGTGHTFNFNPETGEPLCITTAQGYADASCWSRGQAWAVHGFAYMYAYTQDKHYLDLACKLADHAAPRIHEDGIPIWDFDLPSDEKPYRDSSAAAIFAAGFLMLEKYAQDGKKYGDLARKSLDTLAKDYAIFNDPEAEGILLHGASHVKQGRADNLLPYGDYFYLEAQLRNAGYDRFFW